MQILRFYLTPVRIAKIKNSGENRCWQGCGERGTLLHCWWGCWWGYNYSRNQSGSSSENWARHFQRTLLYHSWAYTQRIPQHVIKDTCSTMFIAALFIIARSWKEPRYPSTEEWRQKMWYIYRIQLLETMNS